MEVFLSQILKSTTDSSRDDPNSITRFYDSDLFDRNVLTVISELCIDKPIAVYYTTNDFKFTDKKSNDISRVIVFYNHKIIITNGDWIMLYECANLYKRLVSYIYDHLSSYAISEAAAAIHEEKPVHISVSMGAHVLRIENFICSDMVPKPQAQCMHYINCIASYFSIFMYLDMEIYTNYTTKRTHDILNSPFGDKCDCFTDVITKCSIFMDSDGLPNASDVWAEHTGLPTLTNPESKSDIQNSPKNFLVVWYICSTLAAIICPLYAVSWLLIFASMTLLLTCPLWYGVNGDASQDIFSIYVFIPLTFLVIRYYIPFWGYMLRIVN